MKNIRQSILDGTFAAFAAGFLERYNPTDDAARVAQKRKWLEGRDANGA
jgi:hypothetical protein